MLKNGTLLGNKWTVDKFIGEGACAKVYIVKESVSSSLDYEIVAKVIPLGNSKSKKAKEQERICNTLNYEYILYTGLLMDFPFAPRRPTKFYGDDQTSGVRFLVMEKLDTDLIGLAKRESISVSTIAGFGLQLLDGLRWLHQKNFVFVDVKPDNFMLKNDRIYFVDFGLVERYVVSAVDARSPGARPFAGTPSFCSLSVHKGGIPTGADDVEALGYVLLSLTSEGRMPWSGATSDAQCIQMKDECDIAQLAADRNMGEVGQLILACRALSSGEAVDYDRCRRLLTDMRDRKVQQAAHGKSSVSGSSNGPALQKADVKKGAKPTSSALPESTSHKVSKASSIAEVVDLTEPVAKKSRTGANSSISSAQPCVEKPVPRSRSKATVVATSSAEFVESKRPVRSAADSSSSTAVFDMSAFSGSVGRLSEGPFSSSRVTRSSMSPVPVKSVGSRVDSSAKKPSAAPASATKKPFSADTSHSHTDHIDDAPFTAKPAAVSKSSAGARSGPVAEAAALTYKFEVSAGPYAGERFALGPVGDLRSKVLQRSVGRGGDCDVCVDRDDFVSEHHLGVKISKQKLLVQDLGSTNGSYVNGDKLVPKRWIEVTEGALVEVGQTHMRVVAN